jgi:hypothetical protein
MSSSSREGDPVTLMRVPTDDVGGQVPGSGGGVDCGTLSAPSVRSAVSRNRSPVTAKESRPRPASPQTVSAPSAAWPVDPDWRCAS